MLHWLANNWGTILVALVLLAVVAVIVTVQIRNRKKKGPSCGCAGCAEKTKPFFGYEDYVTRQGSFAFISRPMDDAEAKQALDACGKELLWSLPVLE